MGDSPTQLLFVEDDPDIRNVVGRMLRRAGVTFEVATDGMTAFRMAHDRARAGAPYRAIVTDILMPVWDGLTMIKAIQVVSPETRVLVQSSYLDRELTAKLEECPSVVQIFEKPFDVSYFFERILAVLDARAPRAS